MPRNHWVVPVILVVIGLFLLSTVLGAMVLDSNATGSPASAGPLSESNSGSSPTAGASELAQAEHLLEARGGPTLGGPMHCASPVDLASADCDTVGGVTPRTTASDSNGTTIETPPARWGAAMAYDVKDGYVVLFGGVGSSGALLGDTWTFVNGTWTQLTPAKHPSAREGATMTYDATDGYVILFGGNSSTGVLKDTWEFSNGSWTKLTPKSAPPARAWASMTYDAKDGYVLLFGGENSTGAKLKDTWEFVGGAWSRLHPTTSPAARDSASLTYDAADGYVVLFGGVGAAPTNASLNDTWKFAGGSWTQLHLPTQPSARFGADMAYDTAVGYVVLFGGYSGSYVLGDTWEFANGTWTNQTPESHPLPRFYAAMTYDARDGVVLLFGGSADGFFVYVDFWKWVPVMSWVWVPVPAEDPNAIVGGVFGYSVAISGTTVVIGAPSESAYGVSEAGQAYIVNTKSGVVTPLTSPNPQPSGYFGISVAINGTTVAVGADNETSSGDASAGNVYLFRSTTGEPIATIPPPTGYAEVYGYFGYSVAISGSTLVVGSPNYEWGGAPYAGFFSTFSTTTHQVKCADGSPDYQTGGAFGWSVAISGSTVVVGAPGETAAGKIEAGHAYIWNAKICGEPYQLSSQVPQTAGFFGSSVAISGSTVVVGAPDETTVSGISQAGYAYVFDAKTDDQMYRLVSPNAQTDGEFGFSVAISGTTIVVGAPAETSDMVDGAGNAYTFDEATSYSYVTLVSPAATFLGDFGYSVANSGTIIVVGAPYETSNSAGNAYIFSYLLQIFMFHHY